MNCRSICLCTVLLLCSAAGKGQSRGMPIPVGLRQAEKNPTTDAIPTMVRRPGLDPAECKREADELAKLANSIPLEVEQTSKGLLPKELFKRLKRIEKLSKHLRSELSLQ